MMQLWFKDPNNQDIVIFMGCRIFEPGLHQNFLFYKAAQWSTQVNKAYHFKDNSISRTVSDKHQHIKDNQSIINCEQILQKKCQKMDKHCPHGSHTLLKTRDSRRNRNEARVVDCCCSWQRYTTFRYDFQYSSSCLCSSWN